MKLVGEVIGMVVLLVGCGHVPVAYAQAAPQPSIDLILTETLNRIAPGASTRDDLREIPRPRNDKLADSVRITVTLGDPQCLPGEDGWVGPQRPNRRPVRAR